MTLPKNELFRTLEADGLINQFTVYQFADSSRIEEDAWISSPITSGKVVWGNGGTLRFGLCTIKPSDIPRKLLLIRDFTEIFGQLAPSEPTDESIVAWVNGENSIIEANASPIHGFRFDESNCLLPKTQIFVNDVMQHEVTLQHDTSPVLLDIPASTEWINVRVRIHNPSETCLYPTEFDLIRAVLYR